jgi:hypothetical protein
MRRLFFLSLFFSSLNLMGQSYKLALGVKGGFPGSGGINLKYFIKNSNAIEGTIGGGKNSIFLTGLFEKTNSLEEGFSWYYGGGATLGAYSYFTSTNTKNTEGLAILNGVLGVEYKFEDLPLNLAIDTGPAIEVYPDIGFGWAGALAVRYVIK